MEGELLFFFLKKRFLKDGFAFLKVFFRGSQRFFLDPLGFTRVLDVLLKRILYHVLELQC